MVVSTDHNGMLDLAIADRIVHLDGTLDSTLGVRVQDASLRPHSHFIGTGISYPSYVVLDLSFNIFRGIFVLFF
jgi:hypothetical protein